MCIEGGRSIQYSCISLSCGIVTRLQIISMVWSPGSVARARQDSLKHSSNVLNPDGRTILSEDNNACFICSVRLMNFRYINILGGGGTEVPEILLGVFG